MQSVDFSKTGVQPKALEKKWIGDCPPERFERAPDFMEKEDHESQYLSQRLNAILFRKIREVSDCVSAAIADGTDRLPDLDKHMILNGYKDRNWWNGDESKMYIDCAATLYNHYSYSLKVISQFIFYTVNRPFFDVIQYNLCRY